MMNLEFGMANQFILDLSVNVKRGLRTKINKGWFPGGPPIGYFSNKFNLPDHPPVYSDPDRFAVLKKLWEILIEKRCTLDALFTQSSNWGLNKHKGRGLSRSMFYALFRNPFYYGSFRWTGEIYPGKHEAMISRAQFDAAQRILVGKRPECWTHQAFAFTGLIRCGECGASITAEKKVKHKKNGNTHYYTYYHCTKQIDPDCSQKTIRDSELEIQRSNGSGRHLEEVSKANGCKPATAGHPF